MKEQSVYFAIDDADFKNNARDSKNEFHGTVIVDNQSVKNKEENLSNSKIF